MRDRTEADSKRAWIGLNALLSPRRVLALLERFPSAQAAWEAPLEALERVPGFERRAEDFCRRRAQFAVDRELEAIRRLSLSVLTLEDERYPPPLRGLADPPPVLYVKGEYLERDALALAMVGTRRASAYGRRVTERLARELGRRGLTIVSGLALGIDSAAHRGALSGGARTIAVLGSGFGALYPPENRRLFERIAESGSGCVLSEFPIHTAPARWTFPRRNRLISGLSRGVLVVEAPIKSGALITARLALDQGREVFAVPGNITHPNARGCHYLLKSGATLVEEADDVINQFPDLREVLQPRRPGIPAPGPGPAPEPESEPALSPLEQKLYEALDFEPVHFNDLVERTGLSPTEVSFALLQLQMKQRAVEAEGKRYAKLP